MGTIERCRIHDLLRDVAINEAKEERFLSINPQHNKRMHPRERRVAIHSENNDDAMHHYTPNLRSLLKFGVKDHQWVEYRLLRVLELNNVLISYLSDEVTNMINLRYLGLINTCIEFLPESISRLENLQTLDIDRESSLRIVPASLWDIISLRHVLSTAIKGPQKQANLPNLQTLTIYVGAWEDGFPHLDNVKNLGLHNSENRDWKPAVEMLRSMDHLISLYVRGVSLSPDLINMDTFASYECMQSLTLEGEWPNNLSLNASKFPCHLTSLTLSRLRFEQDPMLELKNMQNLKWLFLDYNATTCKKMICSSGGFHQLEKLIIYSLEVLEELCVEEGSLPALKLLSIGMCKKLRMLPYLSYVSTLKELYLHGMSNELFERANPENGEDWHKIKNILSIKTKQWLNEWFDERRKLRHKWH